MSAALLLRGREPSRGALRGRRSEARESGGVGCRARVHCFTLSDGPPALAPRCVTCACTAIAAAAPARRGLCLFCRSGAAASRAREPCPPLRSPPSLLPACSLLSLPVSNARARLVTLRLRGIRSEISRLSCCAVLLHSLRALAEPGLLSLAAVRSAKGFRSRFRDAGSAVDVGS